MNRIVLLLMVLLTAGVTGITVLGVGADKVEIERISMRSGSSGNGTSYYRGGGSGGGGSSWGK